LANQRQNVVNEEAANVWRGEKYVYPEVTLSQHRAIPDGYHFNFDNLETSIKNTHDSAEAARNAAVAAQDAADAWRKGSTPNAGPVLSLAQGQPGPIWTDYDKHAEDLSNTLDTHNAAWWAEHKAQIAKQKAVDAWRDGYTANTGPELPYSLI